MIKFDFSTYTQKYLNKVEYNERLKKIQKEFLENGKMKGWYNLEDSYKEVDRIETIANYIKESADIFLVIGVGGSYLGSKAIISAFSSYFKRSTPEILFVGYNLSSNYLFELLEYIRGKRIVVNVISKSGNTIEPNIAFNKIYEYMESVYSMEELKNRIIITTNNTSGNLLEIANKINCEKFVIPDEVGGRFSVLTSVGLLPVAVSGINIRNLLEGAKASKDNLNDAYTYAMIRDNLYNSGRKIESFTIYEEKLSYFTEWLKQLFAETQGKNDKAILPISMINTRDLHSLGQYIQDGTNMIFETNIYVKNQANISVKNYDKNLNEIEFDALNSVCISHYNGHTPSIIITMDEINEYNFGYLIFFFYMASVIGAYLLEVNYYDQPGVNGYKDILTKKLKNKENLISD